MNTVQRFLTHSSCMLMVCVATAALCGCQAPMKVGSGYGPGIRFYAFGSTFDWRPNPKPTEKGDARLENPEMHAFIQQTIVDGFVGKGYTLQTGGTPDFGIDYIIGGQTRGGLRHAQWSEAYEEGALVIDVVDAESRELIWRGWATARVDPSDPPSKRRDRIQRAVSLILERFPSRGAE